MLVWTGERIAPAAAIGSAVQVRIADRAHVLGLLRDPQVHFGDAYSAGRIEIEGDLVKFMEIVYRGFRPSSAADSIAPSDRAAGCTGRGAIRSPVRATTSIVTTISATSSMPCGWARPWPIPVPTIRRAEATLEQAQIAKMDHVCRKLRLGAGDSVVEAGCGWGSLALHMASRYGAKVRAFNISSEQIEYARERAREQGLEDRVEFIEDDYRNITGRYDVFVSVGMLEHVGRENYAELGASWRGARSTPKGAD